MPNATPITLNDGVDDTIVSPDSVSSTHVLYQDLTEPKMDERTLLHFDRPARENGTIRRSVRTNLPLKRQDAAGNALPPRMITVKIEYIAPMDSTDAERETAYELAKSAQLSADVKSLFVNPEWVW